MVSARNKFSLTAFAHIQFHEVVFISLDVQEKESTKLTFKISRAFRNELAVNPIKRLDNVATL